jgi:hypothetical protein
VRTADCASVTKADEETAKVIDFAAARARLRPPTGLVDDLASEA